MELLLYGSTTTGLMTVGSSDVDLTLILFKKSDGKIPLISHNKFLSTLKNLLSKAKTYNGKSRYFCQLRSLKKMYLLHLTD